MSGMNTFKQRLENVAKCGTVSRILDGMEKKLFVSKHILQLHGKNQLEGFLTCEMR